jgi:hypothetical protein
MIQRELGKDNSLLKIMNADNFYLSNEVIMMCEAGDDSGLKRIVADGFDILQCRGLNGYTPLHHACSRGHAIIVFEVLRLKVPVDATNDNGESALHLAVYAGHILITEQLLDKGASIDLQNSEGETPLFYAARRSQSAIIRLLLQRGADVRINDRFDETAIDHIPSSAPPTVRRAFEQHKEQRRRAYGSGGGHPQTGDSEDHTTVMSPGSLLMTSHLLSVFSFLQAKDVLRCACVCSQWHRASEDQGLWSKLGIRKWELALQSSLGFGPTASASFVSFGRSTSRSNSFKSLSSTSSKSSRSDSKSSS